MDMRYFVGFGTMYQGKKPIKMLEIVDFHPNVFIAPLMHCVKIKEISQSIEI